MVSLGPHDCLPHPGLWVIKPWRNLFNWTWKKKIMTVCDWAGWAQSQKCPLCKSWVQMWWRSLSTCVALPSTPSLSALSGVPAEPGQILRAQGCPEHSSVLSATPSPHSLVDTHCRGTSAANSQWPTRKCQDNLWFHFCPSWFLSWLGSWFQCCPHVPWPQRDRIQPHFFTLPLPVAWSITPQWPALWEAPWKCRIWDCEWLKTPNHTLHTQSPLLEPLTNLTRSLQKTHKQIPAQVRTGGNKDYNRKEKKSDK